MIAPRRIVAAAVALAAACTSDKAPHGDQDGDAQTAADAGGKEPMAP